MYLQTSHYHLVKNNNTNVPDQDLEEGPYPLIQPKRHLIYLEWDVIFDQTKRKVGTIALKQLKDMMTFEIIFHFDIEGSSLEFALELLKLIMNYAFETLKVQKLVMRVRVIDFDRIRLLHRLGMILEEKLMIGNQAFAVYRISHQQPFSMMKMRASSFVQSQILQFVKQEEAIRLIIQTGHRLNGKAPIDLLRDYHYRLFVKDECIDKYLNDLEWMDAFGDIVISKKTILSEQSYLIQTQFKDGVRLDLEFIIISHLWAAIYEETLSRVILDKDGLLHSLDEPNDSGYYIQRPTDYEFNHLLNNIWWHQIEVAKALYRDEVPLVVAMYEGVLLDEIATLLSWQVGIKYEWKVDLGRKKRWLKRYLPDHLYTDYIALYRTESYNSIWDHLFFIGPFVQKIGSDIASSLGFTFDKSQGEKITQFLHRMNSLPDNATDFNS